MRRKAQTEGYGAFLGLYPRGLAGACRRMALPYCLLACFLDPKPSAALRRGDVCTAPQPLRRLQCCPAGEIARPTI